MADPATISERFAAHAFHTSYSDLPAEVVDAAKAFVLDTIGVGVAGAGTPESRSLASVAGSWGSGAEARVWGQAVLLPAAHAALVTSHQTHCLEFDSIHEPAVVHPLTVLLPCLIADAERRSRHGERSSGEDLIAAVAVGVDIAGGLGDVTTTPLQFFRPGTAGLFGAVVALANARRLPPELTTEALGLAYGQVSGTMQPHTEGSPILPLQVGFNARSALNALDLALAGHTGPRQIFEGRFGYFRLIEADGRPDELADRLGSQWEIVRVSHKPFPSGRATHSGIDGTLRLMTEHGFTADDVDWVLAIVPPMIHHLVSRPLVEEPHPNYARLSLPFQIASALVDGRIDLDTVRPDRLNDPRIRELTTRVRIEVDDNPDPNAFDPQTLRIGLTDGSVREITLPRVLGSPPNPLSRAAQIDKFVACLRFGAPDWPETRAERIVDLVDRLETLDDLTPLLDLL